MVQIEGEKLSWYEKDSFNIKKKDIIWKFAQTVRSKESR
jgi:hypothetical protein